tara:strand:- start:106 stop:810 length:705 start_codon:yes stop_codon:yes gene_type:complete
MDISVIIPTYNEEKNIVKCVESLKKQDYKGEYEIIVSDGSSKDNTTKVAKKLGCKVITQKSAGVGGARNDGFKISKGKILATIDADCTAPKNWLSVIDENFKSGTVCVFGKTLPDKQTGEYKLLFKIGNFLIHHVSRTNMYHNICGANCAFERNAFLEIGGYSNLPISDDTEIGIRLKKKGRVKYSDDMYVYFSTRRLDKFGKYKQIGIWLSNMFKLISGRANRAKDNYSKQDY